MSIPQWGRCPDWCQVAIIGPIEKGETCRKCGKELVPYPDRPLVERQQIGVIRG